MTMSRRKIQSAIRTIKNPLTLSMLVLALFVFSTMLLFSPRMSHFTEVSKTYLIPPVVRTRNLHDTPTFKPIADFQRPRAEPQELNLSSLKVTTDTDLKSSNSRPTNVSKSSQSNSNSSSDSTLAIRHLSLIGRVSLEMQPMDIARIVAMFSFMKNGHFKPEAHPPEEKVAILIPYRNRRKHLYILLPVLIPLLMRQNLEFGIFVVELDPPTTFNKGVLFNAGFLEIMKTGDYQCIILHDVDLIPLDDRNLYRCHKDHPIHFSANIVDYKLFYNGLFGGVVGFTPAQFKAINGASNLYFGWGGEDDDLRDRALGRNFTIIRKPPEHAVYKMVNHTRRGYWKMNPNRFRMFASRRDRWSYDGLNSLTYDVTKVMDKHVMTWIHIAVNATRIQETLPEPIRARQKQDFLINVNSGILNLKCSSAQACPPS